LRWRASLERRTALPFEPKKIVDSQSFGTIGQPGDEIAEPPFSARTPPGVSMRREVGDGGGGALVHGWIPPAAASFCPIEGSTLRIAAASDGIDPFLRPELRRVFQRVQRTVPSAALIASYARDPARPGPARLLYPLSSVQVSPCCR
jgi:hypothetical protein